MTTTRALIYARISNDREGTEVGVDTQQERCRELAERLGLDVEAVYVDNDAGASTLSRKKRPAYDELLAHAERIAPCRVLAYSTSRLTRRPYEFEHWIAAHERGVTVDTVVTGQVNLATADGKAMARTLAAWDGAEAERTSERVRMRFDRRARDGHRHGPVPYGWRDPSEAAVIRESARRLLAGQSARSVWRALNEAGVCAPRGGRWDTVTFRQVMQRPSNAGLRQHRGVIVGDGAWDPIYDRATHEQVVVALAARASSATAPGRPPAHLLSGIARCGRCDTPMHANRAGSSKPWSYACPGCFRVRRRADRVDEVVETFVRARLADLDVTTKPSGVVGIEGAEVVALRDRLAEVDRQMAEGKVSGDQWAYVSGLIRGQIEDAQAAEVARLDDAVRVTGWDAYVAADLASKRDTVRALVDVVIEPQGPGRRFDPGSVRLAAKASS